MDIHSNFTRIIHPIGQGAFYSEQLEYNDEYFNVVFDCGSWRSNNTTKILKSEISSRFVMGEEIEILFISHFDNDHINGVQALINHKIKIKNIVIPLVEEKDFWFFSKEYGMDYNSFKNLYNSLCASADKVYKVKPVNIEDSEEHNRKNINLSENKNEQSEEIIDSNTLLRINNIFDWCYIVFNYNMDTKKKIFLKNLEKEGLTLDVFCHGFEHILSHIEQIKNAYKKLNKEDGLNLSSLIVYSGGYNKRYSCITTTNCCGFCRIIDYHYNRYILCVNEGCLYSGDTNLNQNRLIDDLKYKLKDLSKHVGIIQIPHHGCRKNFNNDIFTLNDDIIFCFVSYGSKNDYGHPSISMLSRLRTQGKIVFEVTENRCTYLSQRLDDVRHGRLLEYCGYK